MFVYVTHIPLCVSVSVSPQSLIVLDRHRHSDFPSPQPSTRLAMQRRRQRQRLPDETQAQTGMQRRRTIITRPTQGPRKRVFRVTAPPLQRVSTINHCRWAGACAATGSRTAGHSMAASICLLEAVFVSMTTSRRHHISQSPSQRGNRDTTNTRARGPAASQPHYPPSSRPVDVDRQRGPEANTSFTDVLSQQITRSHHHRGRVT